MQISSSVVDLIASAFFTLFGAGLVVFRKAASIQAMNWNTKLWRFAAKEKEYQVAFLLVGSAFMIIGVLVFWGVVHFRK